MKIAIDVYYYGEKAKAVGLMFNSWGDMHPYQIVSIQIDKIEPYESGNFYKRELPCIMQLMSEVEHKNIEEIIIDGYVYLGNELNPGLGKYVYEAFQCQHPVIGVAKTPYHHNKELAIQVTRGHSKNPLYITSIGIKPEISAENIRSMAGNSRIPILLKLLDQYTRQ